MSDRPLPILAYHSFSASATKTWLFDLEPALLDEHLAYLRERNFFSLTLAESVHSQELAVSARPLVLTFNGAFQDFERALPLLNKYHFSATLFVPTAFVGQQSSWLPEQRPMLDWEALRSLPNIEIASLGHEHLHLTQVSEAAAKEDMSRSKGLLENNLGLPCQTFAYPYGEHNATLHALLKEAGFIGACTLQAEVSSFNHDVYTLPRFAITAHSDIPEMIGVKNKGRFAFLDFFRPHKQRRLPPPQTAHPLPTKVTTEQVRQERNQQVALLRSGVGGELSSPRLEPYHSPHQPEPSRPELRHPELPLNNRAPRGHFPEPDFGRPISTPLPPRSVRETLQERAVQQVSDLEQQGDFLADLKTWTAQQQGKHLIEYNMLLGAVDRLQGSQEAEVFAPERVRAVYQAQAQLEAALANELNQHTEHQRVKLQGLLQKLNGFPELESLQGSMHNAKHIVQDYLEHLKIAALSEDVLSSTEQLILSLERRLNTSYRAELQRLVQEATSVKALDFLVTLQRAGNGLEQGRYPDLTALKQSLHNLRESHKSQHQMQQRTVKFAKELANAARTFETVSTLNNEDVDTVRQLLYYLLEQREVFPKVSSAMQQELETSLKEVKDLLEGLEKDHQATQAIASQLVTDGLFDNIFGDDAKK